MHMQAHASQAVCPSAPKLPSKEAALQLWPTWAIAQYDLHDQ